MASEANTTIQLRSLRCLLSMTKARMSEARVDIGIIVDEPHFLAFA